MTSPQDWNDLPEGRPLGFAVSQMRAGRNCDDGMINLFRLDRRQCGKTQSGRGALHAGTDFFRIVVRLAEIILSSHPPCFRPCWLMASPGGASLRQVIPVLGWCRPSLGLFPRSLPGNRGFLTISVPCPPALGFCAPCEQRGIASASVPNQTCV